MKEKRETKKELIKRLMRECKVVKPDVTIPVALEFRRDQYGLTAREFSKIIGISENHYSEVIHGKRPLPVKSMIRAYAIGVPATVLLANVKREYKYASH